VRWLPARVSIDRSLEDKPLGGRKKIVITVTIALNGRGGEKERERERERERDGDKKKDQDGAARCQSSASSCVSLKFFVYPIQHYLLLKQISFLAY